jgi:hypothetical protein
MCGHRVEALEHHPDAGAQPVALGLRRAAAMASAQCGDIRAVEQDLPGVGAFQQVEAAQQCALARAGGADDADDIAGRDVERHAAQHAERAEAFGQVADGEQRPAH